MLSKIECDSKRFTTRLHAAGLEAVIIEEFLSFVDGIPFASTLKEVIVLPTCASPDAIPLCIRTYSVCLRAGVNADWSVPYQ
jgi:hypothetical protein